MPAKKIITGTKKKKKTAKQELEELRRENKKLILQVKKGQIDVKQGKIETEKARAQAIINNPKAALGLDDKALKILNDGRKNKKKQTIKIKDVLSTFDDLREIFRAKENSQEVSNLTRGKIKILNSVDALKKLNKRNKNINILCTLNFSVSKDQRIKRFILEGKNKTYDNILNDAVAYAEAYIAPIDDAATFAFLEIKIGRDAVFDIEVELKSDVFTTSYNDMPLNEVKYIKLPYKTKANNIIINNNCVVEALNNLKLSKKKKKIIEEVKNWTVKKLIDISEELKLNINIYDGSLKNVLKSKHTKDKLINVIASNEHLYYIEKNELNAIKAIKKDDLLINSVQFCDNLTNLTYNKMYDQPIEYFNVDIDDNDKPFINTMYSDSILYTCDLLKYNAFKLYKHILKDQFFINKNFKIWSPLFMIAEKFKIISSWVHDFEPPKAILYNNPKYKNDKNLKCVDGNKFYTYIFMNLKYIPIINNRCIVQDFDGDDNEDIISTNFYFISNIKKDLKNMFNYGWTSGYKLLAIDNILDVVSIKYFIEPVLIDNPFKDIIKKMLKHDPETTKQIINRFIGCMQKGAERLYINIYNGLHNNLNEIEEYNKNYVILDNKFYATYDDFMTCKKYKNNMMPLAHYIIDHAAIKIMTMLNDLKQMDNNIKIVKIKIDSITFKSDKIKYKDLNLTDEPGGWKKEKPNIKDIYYEPLKINKPVDIKQPLILKDYNFIKDKNIFYNSMAGSGKSYFIINKLLDVLKDDLDRNDKDEDNNILIISACHASLFEYYQLEDAKINVKVIQYFENAQREFKKVLQKTKYIIIEECGLLSYDHWKFIYNNILEYNYIIALGDTDQLKPVDNTSAGAPLKNNLIRSIFDYEIKRDFNFRNNYKIEQYYKMIEGDYKIKKYEKCKMEILSENNICYFVETVDKINNQIIDNLKWDETFNNQRVKRGGFIISYSNDLKIKNIYNNFKFEIIDYTKDEKKIILKDCITNNNIILTDEEFISGKFKPAYATTLYRVQGKSIDYNNISFWDWDKIKKVSGGVYTALSRIKEDIIIDVDEKIKIYEPIKKYIDISGLDYM